MSRPRLCGCRSGGRPRACLPLGLGRGRAYRLVGHRRVLIERQFLLTANQRELPVHVDRPPPHPTRHPTGRVSSASGPMLRHGPQAPGASGSRLARLASRAERGRHGSKRAGTAQYNTARSSRGEPPHASHASESDAHRRLTRSQRFTHTQVRYRSSNSGVGTAET